MVYNEYIALAKPEEAAKLCSDYGIEVDVNNPEDISEGLSAIVAQNGKEGLKDVMDIHPDKSVLLELTKKEKKHFNYTGSDDDQCSCGNCMARYMVGYNRFPLGNTTYSATGDTSTSASINNQTAVMMQQNTFIVLGVAVIAAVLLIKSK
jgi:hypothetical protein